MESERIKNSANSLAKQNEAISNYFLTYMLVSLYSEATKATSAK